MLNTLSTAYRSWAFKVTSWLVLAAIAGGLTFMVWVASAVKPAKKVKHQSLENPAAVEPAALLANRAPDEMKQLVQPIKFDAVIRDMRNYPKEFKDSHFIKDNQGKWTVQVMNVVEHEVITDYLNGRPDRDKFNYFRIVDKDKQKRFVLTYGTFNSSQEALSAIKTTDFSLPSNIRVFPEEFRLYAPQMDEYEITPPLKDTGHNAPRDVKLHSAQNVIPGPRAKPKPMPEENRPTAHHTRRTDTSQTSIERSQNRDDTLNIQERRAPVSNENADNFNTRPEPSNRDSSSPRSSRNNSNSDSGTLEPREPKPATRETNSNKSNDSMANLINQKSE